MGNLIAITGKGGTGKTTIAALLIGRLLAHGRRPVLAVDADPNSCLAAALGVQATKSVGAVREEAREIAGKGLAAGIAKQELLELKIAECLVEADDFDLIAMGRPEGPGCYCYANSVLKATLAHVAAQYPYVVLDNEAGLENVSRRLAPKIDLLLIVADSSRGGLETVRRLHGLAREMNIEYSRLGLIVNRLDGPAIPAGALELQAAIAANFVLGLPEDRELKACNEAGGSLLALAAHNSTAKALDAMWPIAGPTGDA
jgi:CO dehydrogenase maturation factor